MLSLSSSFLNLLRLKATLLFCYLFVFLEQLDSDPQKLFSGTRINASNYLFSFRAYGHQSTAKNQEDDSVS